MACSLKRKAYSSTTEDDSSCDLCGYADPILSSAACGHTFHSRCVSHWPIATCPVCDIDMPQVSILPLDMETNFNTRAGKWTEEEQQFIQLIMEQYESGMLPLPERMPIRVCLARLLNVDPMRISKKFQKMKNPLGKRHYHMISSDTTTTSTSDAPAKLCFSQIEHRYRQSIAFLINPEGKNSVVQTKEAAKVIDAMSRAVKQFWVLSFIKLALAIKQPIEGLVAEKKDRRTKKQKAKIYKLSLEELHHILPHIDFSAAQETPVSAVQPEPEQQHALSSRNFARLPTIEFMTRQYSRTWHQISSFSGLTSFDEGTFDLFREKPEAHFHPSLVEPLPLMMDVQAQEYREDEMAMIHGYMEWQASPRRRRSLASPYHALTSVLL